MVELLCVKELAKFVDENVNEEQVALVANVYDTVAAAFPKVRPAKVVGLDPDIDLPLPLNVTFPVPEYVPSLVQFPPTATFPEADAEYVPLFVKLLVIESVNVEGLNVLPGLIIKSELIVVF